MRGLGWARGLPLVAGSMLLLAAILMPGADRAGGGPSFPGGPPPRAAAAAWGAPLPSALEATVRLARAPRWSSEDLADFICFDVREESVRSVNPRGPSLWADHPQTGAGVVLDGGAFIVTADTLVSCEGSAQVWAADGRVGTERVVGRDPLLNVAVLAAQLPGGPIPGAPVGGVGGLAIGSDVMVPARDRNVARLAHTRRGKVLQVGRVTGSGLFGPQIETDIPLEEVEIGAPLLDSRGKVVGLIVPPVSSFARGARAVPMDAVLRVLPALAGLGRVPRGWLGLVAQPLTRPLADLLGVGGEGRPLIAYVIRGGPADRAGIRAGDIVVGVGDLRVRSVEALAEGVAGLEIGSTVRVDALRGGQAHSFSVRVAETPQSSDWPPRSEPLPKLGIHVLPVTPGLRHLWDPRLADGLLINRVVSGGPGEAMSLEPGDLLRAVNGQVLVGRQAIGLANRALESGRPALWLVERVGFTRLVASVGDRRVAGGHGPTGGSPGPNGSGSPQER